MLARLDASGEGKGKSEILWQPVRFTLVDVTGEPVSGQVSISGKPLGASDAIQLPPQSEPIANGQIDLGPLPPGQYRAVAIVPGVGAAQVEFLHRPDRASEQRIVCPHAPAPLVEWQFELKPPVDLARDSFYYLAELKRQSWRYAGRIWQTNGCEAIYLLDAQGKTLGEVAPIDAPKRHDHSYGYPPGEPPLRCGWRRNCRSIDLSG